MENTHASNLSLGAMIEENDRRWQSLRGHFDPITGQESVGERVEVKVDLDLPTDKMPCLGMQTQWWPLAMMQEPQVIGLMGAGGVLMRYVNGNPVKAWQVYDQIERLRIKHDFAYWAAKYVYIKRKGGGDDCLFRLTYPQRKMVALLEQMRVEGRPIRIVLLKARQWGGSTTSQLYMAWLQLTQRQGLNSLIIAHQATATEEIKDMFDRMIDRYPERLLRDEGLEDDPKAKKMENVGKTRSIFRVASRNCKIKVGTAERPDSCRGGDYNLVHLSEVGMWKQTKGKKPEDIVRAACSGVLYQPYTMIVYESTANGIGNFFHKEYVDARDNQRSQFRALFVAWHEIEQNAIAFADEAEKKRFAKALYQNRLNADAKSNREESGRYLWRLWQGGATLEGINWYVAERAKHTLHGSMAAECPTDDTEAFVNSGAAVFDMYQVEKLRGDCCPPRWIGDVYGDGLHGESALANLKFAEDGQGLLHVWSLPESGNSDERVEGRYIAVVDIGGRSYRSDWSVILVLDRLPMLDGGRPEVAAQWYGHIDMDLLAWKSAQVAAFYDNALLVIESNTLETHDPLRQVDGDQSQFVLNQIKRVYTNLYARKPSEDDIRAGMPRKYGFHTNIATKPMIISTLVRVVREHLYVERDERCLGELLTYERKANGSYGAIIGAHDDLLMTRAIGLHICFCEMEMPRKTPRWGAGGGASRKQLF